LTKWWAVALMVLCTFLASVAQFFYKKGAAALSLSFSGIFLIWPLYIGVFIYLVGAVFMIIAFRGGELSVLYPVIATSYIWVNLISMFWLNETVNLMKWFGIGFIILGITFIGFGSRGAHHGN
jgi:multidrug transporter EmrE-like cation transporter